MNILTFDIEEWFLEKHNHGNRPERIKLFDQFLNQILDLLDERQLKATFFCVGGMGIEFPHVIKLIESRGHEMGCHSYRHTWLNKMSRAEVLQDTREAVDALEQCIGKKILSYRAPAFSIGERTHGRLTYWPNVVLSVTLQSFQLPVILVDFLILDTNLL